VQDGLKDFRIQPYLVATTEVAGRWREVLNTGATAYNGAGIGNLGGVGAAADVGAVA
jgi:hypothetical protein